ncbi:MAG TPA: HD domain-containing phosphohydrolase [Abditibacteriaceae bacterium]
MANDISDASVFGASSDQTFSQSVEAPSAEAWHKARVLVVDDEPMNVLLLQRVLAIAGYESVKAETDPHLVAAYCETWKPDVILLDLMMPGLDGFGVLEALRPQFARESYLPVLVLTADVSPEAKRRALAEGARDYLTKPFDHAEVLLRVRNLLETRFLYQRLGQQNAQLEDRVRERTQELERSRHELEESQQEVLQRLAQAAEFRDDDTGQHTQRVGRMTGELARAISLDESQCEVIQRAAPLHDVGKIGISDTILLKPGKLTPEEFETMKAHTTIGGAMLEDGHSPLVMTAQTIAVSHHERWDGSGYPNGLHGDRIPIEGRLLALVDVFDALTHARPYKEAWPVEKAMQEIERAAGRQFDPALIEPFRALVAKRT